MFDYALEVPLTFRDRTGSQKTKRYQSLPPVSSPFLLALPSLSKTHHHHGSSSPATRFVRLFRTLACRGHTPSSHTLHASERGPHGVGTLLSPQKARMHRSALSKSSPDGGGCGSPRRLEMPWCAGAKAANLSTLA